MTNVRRQVVEDHVAEDAGTPEDALELLERALADAEELRRVLDREADLLAADDWDGVQLLADQKRWYGDRVHVHLTAVRYRREDLAALSPEVLAPFAEAQAALAESARRNALALAQKRDMKQRIVDVIAQVARERGCPVTVYGANGRTPALRAAGRAAPVNINGQF